MAQLLILEEKKRRFYQPIASIRDYREQDFEDKLYKFAKDLFPNYFTVRFKYGLQRKSDINQVYKPDLLLISKNFNKWIILEVELCKPDLTHAIKQIDTFLDPYFNEDHLIKFLLKHNPFLTPHREDLIDLIKTKAVPPELLLIFDDYDDRIFSTLNNQYSKKIRICVLEVYREAGNAFDAYRIGGRYPYDITNSSKLIYINDQHYQIQKPEIVTGFPEGEIEILFNMMPLNGYLIKPRRKGGKFLLKIIDHNFNKNHLLHILLDVENKLIIEIL